MNQEREEEINCIIKDIRENALRSLEQEKEALNIPYELVRMQMPELTYEDYLSAQKGFEAKQKIVVKLLDVVSEESLPKKLRIALAQLVAILIAGNRGVEKLLRAMNMVMVDIIKDRMQEEEEEEEASRQMAGKDPLNNLPI